MAFAGVKMHKISMNHPYEIVVIGGSAGSFNVVRKLLTSLEAGFTLPLVLCLHRLRDIPNGFVESLQYSSTLKVVEPEDKQRVCEGYVYLCPSNYHLLIEEGGTFALSVDEAVNYSRPCIDMTFESAGRVYGKRMIGILLSGANADGANGICESARCGAYTIVQDPDEALFRVMPAEALKRFKPDRVLKANEITGFLTSVTDQ